MKRHAFTIITLLFSFFGYSQSAGRVGEIAPDILFSRYQNGEEFDDKLSNYRGKFIIIDFWKTYCGTCVAGLASLEKLQMMWPDKLHVIAVNDQPADLVKDFWKSNAVTKGLTIGTAVGENVFTTVFKHTTVPHYVILAPDRKIIAVTFKEYVNEENIRALINGKMPHFEKKVEIDRHYLKSAADSSIAMTADTVKILGESLLTGYVSGLQSSKRQLQLDTAAEYVTLRVTNNSLPDLIRFTIDDGEIKKFRKRQIYLNMDSSILYVNARQDRYKKEWEKKHLYCYSVMFKKGVPLPQVLSKMKSDLEFHLGLNISIQNTLTNVWVLKRRSDYGMERFSEKTTKNIRLLTLLDLMNAETNFPHVVDETGLPGDLPMDLASIPTFSSDIQKMNESLLKLGLLLVETKRRINLLVVK